MLSLAVDVGGLVVPTSLAVSPLTVLFIETVGATVGGPLGTVVAEGAMVLLMLVRAVGSRLEKGLSRGRRRLAL